VGASTEEAVRRAPARNTVATSTDDTSALAGMKKA
jgi:hypothetical protein